MKQKRDTADAACLPYDYNTCFADSTLHLYKKYSEQVIVYAVVIHQKNISSTNEVRSANMGTGIGYRNEARARMKG